MAEPVVFENRNFLVPGAFSKFKITSKSPIAVDTATMIIIGESEGGTPWDASDKDDTAILESMTFTNLPEARTKLRRGDLLDAADMAFNPTTDPILSGARRVVMIRSNKATRSTIVLESNSLDTVNVFSADYGKHANRTAIEVIAAVDPVTGVPGGEIIVYKDADKQESGNIFNPLIELQYVGSETQADLTFTSVTGALKVNNGTIDFIDILVQDYPSIGELASFLEANDFTVTVLNSSYRSELMDDIDISVDVLLAEFLTATYDAQVRFLNLTSEFTTAEQVPSSLKKPLDSLAKTFLTGATQTAASNADWIGSIALAEKQEGFYQIEMSGLPAIAQINKNSVTTSASFENRRERIGGSGTGDYLATPFPDRRQEAKNLNSAFYNYGASPFDRINSDGILTTFQPKFLMVLSFAINSGNGPTTASTFKALNILGSPEVKDMTLGQGGEAEKFILAGAQVITNNELTGAPQITRSVTTFQGANLIASEMSMIATALAMVKDFRIQLEADFIGQTPGGSDPSAGPGSGNSMVGVVEAKAKRLLDGYVSVGFLTGDAVQAAYDNFKIVSKGDKIFIEKDATLTSPLNFIFDIFNVQYFGANT